MCTSPEAMGLSALTTTVLLLYGNVTSAFGSQLWLPKNKKRRCFNSSTKTFTQIQMIWRIQKI